MADDELACEDVIIERPVLEHLKSETATLFDHYRASLDGTDCSMVRYPTVPKGGGFVSRVMTARANLMSNDCLFEDHRKHPDPNRPQAEYDYQRSEEDPSPNPSLLDMVDADQAGEV